MVNPLGLSSNERLMLFLKVTEIFFFNVMFIPINGEKFWFTLEDLSLSLYLSANVPKLKKFICFLIGVKNEIYAPNEAWCRGF